MDRLPKIICSSVIRSVQKGDSHGGIYIIDLETEEIKQVVDWNKTDIDWSGRGGDRGIRGIAFYNENIYVAIDDSIIVYDINFKTVDTIKNKYLKALHEINICGDSLYIASTFHDSIIEYDLKNKKFKKGYCFRRVKYKNKYYDYINRLFKREKFDFFIYDPNSDDGPIKDDTCHINYVSIYKDKIYFCGTGITNIYEIDDDKVERFFSVPKGTHNAGPIDRGIIMNDTVSEKVVYYDTNEKSHQSFEIKKYSTEEMIETDIPNDHARQSFGRGLAVYNDYIIGGSSPATISVYKFGEKKPVKILNVSNNIRNAIHGLEIWPY